MKISWKTSVFASIPLALTLALGLSCSNDSKDDDASTSGDEVAASNPLATAYPGALALSVFPDESASAGLMLQAEGDAAKQIARPPKEKLDDAKKRLKGEADCFDKTMAGEHQGGGAPTTCYDFDSDMNPVSNNGREYGTTDGTDGSGQACMVTFAKQQVDEIVFKVDRALGMVQGLLCAAKKKAAADGSELSLPEVGSDGLNLKSAMEDELGKVGDFGMNSALMTAYKNDDGSVGYKTIVSFSTPNGAEDEITLRHNPSNGDSKDESGVLTFKRSGGMQGAPLVGDKVQVMSINYERKTDDDGEEKSIAELRTANISTDYEPLNSKGLVAFENLPREASNSDIEAIKFVAFDINPETGVGDLSYWKNPGGRYTESARGFLFNIKEEDGALAGCGISGATRDVSVMAALEDTTGDKILAPVRYWHPRPGGWSASPDADPRYSSTEGNKITEQCFKQNTETGKYVKTSTHERGYDVKEGSDVEPPRRPDLPPPIQN